MKHICRIVLFLFLSAVPIINCEAKVPVSESYRLLKILFRYGDDALPVLNRLQKVIPENKVDELAKIALDPGGMKKVNAYLGHLALPQKYPDGHKMLSLVYLQIAAKNGVLYGDEAAEVYLHLNNVKGLSSLLSKINIANKSTAKGHLQELRLGLNFQKSGHKVLEFGRKFNDNVKLHDTDLDLLVRLKNGKLAAIESKAYDTAIDTVVVRNDFQSLKYFRDHLADGKAIPVFCFRNPPPPIVKEILEREGSLYFSGNEKELVSLMEQLL